MGCTVNFMGPSYGVNDQLSYAEHMAQQLHIDNFLAFEYTEYGFNDAWERHTGAAKDYFEKQILYEQETDSMSREDRAAYYKRMNRRDKFYNNE